MMNYQKTTAKLLKLNSFYLFYRLAISIYKGMAGEIKQKREEQKNGDPDKLEDLARLLKNQDSLYCVLVEDEKKYYPVLTPYKSAHNDSKLARAFKDWNREYERAKALYQREIKNS